MKSYSLYYQMEQKGNSISIQLLKNIYSAIPDLNIQWQLLKQVCKTMESNNLSQGRHIDNQYSQSSISQSTYQSKCLIKEQLKAQLPVEAIQKMISIREFFKQCLFRNSQLIRSQKKFIKSNQSKFSIINQKSKSQYVRLSEELLFERINERQANKIKCKKRASQLNLCMTSNNFNDKFRLKKQQKIDPRVTQSKVFGNFRVASHRLTSIENIKKQAKLHLLEKQNKLETSSQNKENLQKMQTKMISGSEQIDRDQQIILNYDQLNMQQKPPQLSCLEKNDQIQTIRQTNATQMANISFSQKIAILLDKNLHKSGSFDFKLNRQDQRPSYTIQNNIQLQEPVEMNIASGKFFDFMPKRQCFKGYKKLNLGTQNSKGVRSFHLRANKRHQNDKQNQKFQQKSEAQSQQTFKKLLLGYLKIVTKNEQNSSFSIYKYGKNQCQKMQKQKASLSNSKKPIALAASDQNNKKGFNLGRTWKKLKKYGYNSSLNFKKDGQQPLRALSSSQQKNNIMVIKSFQTKFKGLNRSESAFKNQNSQQKINPIFQKNVSDYVKRASDKKSMLNSQMTKHMSNKIVQHQKQQQASKLKGQQKQNSYRKKSYFQNYPIQ